MLAKIEDPQKEMADALARYTNDPVGFVAWAFPWEAPETELERFKGPEQWQLTVLEGIRDGLLTANQAIQLAVASGHGVGKSALVAWIILWSLTTFEDCRGVVTANTETQLKTKTWAELTKWHRLFMGREHFKMTATAIYNTGPDRERSWRIDLIAWSERSTEAFAGLHNKGKRILVIFDEASAIPDVIWETTEGALTDSDTQIVWMVCGNPTRNSGRFRECFGRFRYRWKTFEVDSRTVSITNKEQFKRWVRDYGEDSDFVRVRVRGVFPRSGSMQFIGLDTVEAATQRELPARASPFEPFIIGVDVARFGDDASCIAFRKGRDARTVEPIILRNVDTMQLSGRVADVFSQYKADAVFVDGGGVGGGVVDRLRQLHVPVFDIQFGGKSDRTDLEEGARSANKRSEIWHSMKKWLEIGCLPNEGQFMQQYREELPGPEYGFNIRDEIQLERKEDMKRRGYASPDLSDALALTFSYPVMPSIYAGGEHAQFRSKQPMAEGVDYDPFTNRAIGISA